MNWQTSAKLVALTGVMTAMSFNAPSVTAQSKDLERTLAGVRLNASSRTVLSKFGNPNEIYIGDIGVRIPGTGAQQGGGMGMGEDGGMAGGPGMMGGMSGGAGPSMMGGMAGGSGPRMGGAGMMGSSGMMGGMAGGGGKMGAMGGGSGSMGAPGGMSGAPSSMMGGMRMGGGSGSMGAPAGMSGAPSSMMGGMRMGGGGSKMGGGDGEMGTMGGGMGGMMGGMGGMMGGMGGDTGGGVGAFGRTQSSVARQQEVTWVYNRTTKDAKGQTTAISYEFLINPGGSISQIRCLGYHSPIKPTTQTPSITTQKGIRLGSSYVEILRAYGQPDSYEKSGNILVLSYPKKHVQFQLINQKEQAEPTKAAYRVIAMTIATVEG